MFLRQWSSFPPSYMGPCTCVLYARSYYCGSKEKVSTGFRGPWHLRTLWPAPGKSTAGQTAAVVFAAEKCAMIVRAVWRPLRDNVDRSGNCSDREVAHPGIPEGVGMFGHLCRHLFVLGLQGVPHGHWQAKYEVCQKEGVVTFGTNREDC